MNSIELRAIVEFLGLHDVSLARYLEVGEASTRRWLSGKSTPGEGVIAEIQELLDDTLALETELEDAGEPINVFVDDRDFWAEHPEEKPLPARWHRQAAGRVHVRTGLPLVLIEAPRKPD